MFDFAARNENIQFIQACCLKKKVLIKPCQRSNAYNARKYEEGLQKLLLFCTGASTVPPMGFHDLVLITSPQLSTLPNANTCPMELELPSKVSNCDKFSRQMKIVLDTQTNGFGIV